MCAKIVGRASFSGHKRTGCPRCGGEAPITQTLYKGNKGVMKACCVECEPEVLEKKKRDVERTALWRKNKADLKEYRAKEAREYRAKSPRFGEYQKEYLSKNREKIYSNRLAYIKKNPWFNRAAAARHRATIKQRTVPWADLEEIKLIYKNCPEGMVVDHIIPLRGKNISGLHVASNLQYLTFEENSRKSNKFEM